jgi:hypothetical protein
MFQELYQFNKSMFNYYTSRIEDGSARLLPNGDIIDTTDVTDLVADDSLISFGVTIQKNDDNQNVIGNTLLNDAITSEGFSVRAGYPKCGSCRPTRGYTCSSCKPGLVAEGYIFQGYSPMKGTNTSNENDAKMEEGIDEDDDEDMNNEISVNDSIEQPEPIKLEQNTSKTIPEPEVSKDVVAKIEGEIDDATIKADTGTENEAEVVDIVDEVDDELKMQQGEEQRQRNEKNEVVAAEEAKQRKKEKKEVKQKRRAMRKEKLLRILEDIQKAETPNELLKVVVVLENCITPILFLPWSRFAAPYDADSVANIAMRIFILDRTIRYETMKEIEKEIIASKKPFKARTQTTNRCMINSTCCGGIWHAGVCGYHYQWKLPIILINSSKQFSASRQYPIIDQSGGTYVPQQGLLVEDNQINEELSAWRRKKDVEEAEARKFQQSFRGLRKRDYNSDSEESFNSRDGKRGKKRDKRLEEIEISWIKPYVPNEYETTEFYDI